MTLLVSIGVALAPLLPLLTPDDPAPGMFRTRSRARSLQCERVSLQTANERYPGRISTPRSRGDFADRSVVICAEDLVRPGLRPAADEAILSTLDDRANELSIVAEALRPDLEGRTWLVEAFYPSAVVGAKITFATKNALMARGLSVSDRAPTLAADDVDIIGRLPPDEAYPAACGRYFATGSLGPDDVLLAVVSRDRRETILHAGLCDRGHWTWLK